MTNPIELPCDHCGKPECQHVEIVGMGKVCRMQGCTFSSSKSRALAEATELRAVLSELVETIEQAFPALALQPIFIRANAALNKGRDS